MEIEVIPKIDQAKLTNFGQQMLSKFEDYKKDRRALENQWLKNMRQFRGIIDPELKSRMTDDQSKAYPKVTRTKVINTVARLMEMLFPNTAKNWKIQPGPVPDLATEDVQQVLATLQAQAENGELTDAQIEKGIMELAEERADRMETEMDDQLADIDYVQLVRRVVFSGVLYSAGVLKGPLVRTVSARTWRKNAEGAYEAHEIKKRVPYYENTPIWNHYPDLSAKTLDQKDGDFERHIMNRAQVRKLMDRPDFMKDQLKTWLNNHPSGNFKEEHWEQELRSTGDKTNVSNLDGRKYVLIEWWGMVDAADLKAAGVNVPADKMDQVLHANVWTIDNVVIKAVLAPIETNETMYHTFIYEEDDISLLGNGLPQVMRDSQLGICEAARMVLDNSSVVTGPMLEVDNDRLVPGQDMGIHAYKMFFTEGNQGSNKPAIREIPISAHIGELSSVVQMFMSFADMETALPPPATGDVTQGGSEALRTQRGASMLLGAASLPIRDTVRNFDRFTESVIGSLYNWNMEFNTNENIKGDFNISALGSTSLIAKEVRAAALNQFRATLTEEEKVYIDTKSMLIERMEANDVPKDVLAKDEEVARRQQEQAATIAEQQGMQKERLEAETRKIITGAFKDMALAHKADASVSTDVLEVILKGLQGALNAAEPDTETTGS